MIYRSERFHDEKERTRRNASARITTIYNGRQLFTERYDNRLRFAEESTTNATDSPLDFAVRKRDDRE